jgi:hypothetical protein
MDLVNRLTIRRVIPRRIATPHRPIRILTETGSFSSALRKSGIRTSLWSKSDFWMRISDEAYYQEDKSGWYVFSGQLDCLIISGQTDLIDE